MFTIEGAGRNVGGTADEFQWAYLPLAGDGATVARFVPQFNSQSSRFGLMIRSGVEADAPEVALLFTNARRADIERPSWHAELLVRPAAGQVARIVAASPDFPAPYVTYGRMVQPYWLKLERTGSAYVASISPDGVAWTQVGSVEAALGQKPLVGLSACSCLGKVTTRIMYDHVSAPGWKMPGTDSQK
jgi:hypothetical protein